MNKENILVIEDETAHSDFIKYVLKKAGYEVTVVATVKKAKKFLSEQRFLVVLLDLTLADGDGFQVLEFINLKQIDTAVIVLSVSRNPDSIIKSFKLGAIDYLIKLPVEDKLIAAINNVEDKKMEIIPLLQRNLDYVADIELLTAREHEILGLIASGSPYTDITEKLFISRNTFKAHVKKIFLKLPCQCAGRTKIVYQFNCTDIKYYFKNGN